MLISKQTTLRGSWIRKLQSSCVHDQNANTSQIFLLALFQTKYKSFYEPLNQLEIDDKLRDSEGGQLMTDRDRNGQYKSSNEEKLLLYMNPFSERNTSISPIESEKQNFSFYLFKVLHNGRMRLNQFQNITGCKWWSHNKQAFNVQYDRKRIKLQL